jgi:hypothetical protein
VRSRLLGGVPVSRKWDAWDAVTVAADLIEAIPVDVPQAGSAGWLRGDRRCDVIDEGSGGGEGIRARQAV